MLADGGRVKPVTCLHVDQRLEAFAVILGTLHLPDLPYAFDIPLHEVSGIGLAAVGDHLDRGGVAAARHSLVEIHRDHHDAAHFPGLHSLN